MTQSGRARPGVAVWFAAAFLLAILLAALFGRAPVVDAPRETVLERAPSAPDEPLRFVALGDQGKGNDKQYAVSAAMERVCEARGGCAFGLLLGDNIYPSGVEGPDDPHWKRTFEDPYGNIAFPFWAALGNHDYGGNGGGWEFWKAEAELAYARKNPKWKMPARHYAFGEGPVDVFVIDTTELFWGRGAEQATALEKRLKGSTAPWKIVAGHHPYVSNGGHGNAGNYDRLPATLPASGTPIKAFIEEVVCGEADLYLAGHDHNLQDLVSPCPTGMVVSGAGASTTRLVGSNPVHFQSDSSGFVLLTATAKELRLEFFDSEATKLHERVLTR